MGVYRYMRMWTRVKHIYPGFKCCFDNLLLQDKGLILKRPENPFLTLNKSPFTIPPKVSPFGEGINMKVELQIWNRSTYSLPKKILGLEAHLVTVDGMACSEGRIRTVWVMIGGRTWLISVVWAVNLKGGSEPENGWLLLFIINTAKDWRTAEKKVLESADGLRKNW